MAFTEEEKKNLS